jgi:hypothetical protein
LRWNVLTPIPDQLRIFKPPGEPSRADLRLEADKAVAEFEARQKHLPRISALADET